MTHFDRRFLAANHIATHRTDRPVVGVWLAASVFCAVMWGALGFAVVMLIGAAR